MPETSTYEYKQHEDVLLRAPKNTFLIEIYREKSDSWEEYDYDGKIEEWYEARTIDPDQVKSLKLSLRALRSQSG